MSDSSKDGGSGSGRPRKRSTSRGAGVAGALVDDGDRRAGYRIALRIDDDAEDRSRGGLGGDPW
jgi:hypothetical protein